MFHIQLILTKSFVTCVCAQIPQVECQWAVINRNVVFVNYYSKMNSTADRKYHPQLWLYVALLTDAFNWLKFPFNYMIRLSLSPSLRLSLSLSLPLSSAAVLLHQSECSRHRQPSETAGSDHRAGGGGRGREEQGGFLGGVRRKISPGLVYVHGDFFLQWIRTTRLYWRLPNCAAELEVFYHRHVVQMPYYTVTHQRIWVSTGCLIILSLL